MLRPAASEYTRKVNKKLQKLQSKTKRLKSMPKLKACDDRIKRRMKYQKIKAHIELLKTISRHDPSRLGFSQQERGSVKMG